MDMNQYLEVFIEESKEHLQLCSEQLLELEKNPEDLSIVNEVFRAAHTLKGMSATMGYEDLANLTHKMENVLDAIRNEKIVLTPETFDTLFLAVDHLEAIVYSIADGGEGKKNVEEVVKKLQLIEKGEPIVPGAFQEAAAASTVLEKVSEGATCQVRMMSLKLTVLQQSKEQGFDSYEITNSFTGRLLIKSSSCVYGF